jgi:hypothetical protein
VTQAITTNNKWMLPIGIVIFLTLFGIQEHRLQSIETEIALLTASMNRSEVLDTYSSSKSDKTDIAMDKLRENILELNMKMVKIDSTIDAVLAQLKKLNNEDH